jgi:5'-nucleotidase
VTGTRPRILLTNDDSHDSPLFHLTIDALNELGDLSIAVPATEQSWKGKSMTRYGPLYVENIEIHGVPAWSVTGTPADCANLAIHNLLTERPDIVVSGINIGKNIGLGFVFASGTVGACLEGNIAGIPGLALSQELTREDFMYWDEHRAFQPETHAVLKARIAELVPRVWHEFIAGHLDQASTWNINFPYAPVATPDIVRTRLGHTVYGQCFTQRGDQYHFGLSATTLDKTVGTDDRTLSDGHVSATLLDISAFGQLV